jgi:hypothetical protein
VTCTVYSETNRGAQNEWQRNATLHLPMPLPDKYYELEINQLVCLLQVSVTSQALREGEVFLPAS